MAFSSYAMQRRVREMEGAESGQSEALSAPSEHLAPPSSAAAPPPVGLNHVQNEQFSAYYRAQLGLPPSEYASFEASLRSPLPVTFRFSATADHAEAISLKTHMERVLLPPLSTLPQPPRALPWYPDGLAWHLDVSRAELRGKGQPRDRGGGAADGGAADALATHAAALKALNDWLRLQGELGAVQRQEAASMVPALLLDVQPGASVLDLCASPGSKSQQLLEMLRAGGADVVEDGGILVANDADVRRCHLLASRASRLDSTQLLITCHDGRLLPETFQRNFEEIRFDRVLCDVPCSGDGTLRKSPVLWRRWVAAQGNALHRLQLQLACKGVRLTKVRRTQSIPDHPPITLQSPANHPPITLQSPSNHPPITLQSSSNQTAPRLLRLRALTEKEEEAVDAALAEGDIDEMLVDWKKQPVTRKDMATLRPGG